jgi:hypothetical protein
MSERNGNGNGKSPTTNGRDRRGRFEPGCPGGPGNPHVRQVASVRATLAGEITPAVVKACIRTLREIVADADAPGSERIAAARELLNRAVGMPTQSIDVSADVRSTQNAQAHAMMDQVLKNPEAYEAAERLASLLERERNNLPALPPAQPPGTPATG